MAQSSFGEALARSAHSIALATHILIALGLCLGAASFLLYWQELSHEALLLVSVTLLCAGCAGLFYRIGQYLFSLLVDKRYAAMMDALDSPSILSDARGKVLISNTAIKPLLAGLDLSDFIANHSADSSVLIRYLIKEAGKRNVAYRELKELSVTVSNPSFNRFFWVFKHHENDKYDGQVLGKMRSDGFGGFARDLENLPISILIINSEGRMISANYSARKLLGSSYGVGYAFHEAFSGLGRSVNDWLQDVILQRVKSSSEVLHLENDDGDHFVHIHISSFYENGTPYIIAIMVDGSSYKRIENQFNQSQKMQAIGQLAGGISHDFNNLLTAISGYCDILLMSKTESDPEYHDLMHISQNTNRASALVSQLLAFSRKQPLKSEVFMVNEALADLSHLLNRLIGERYKLVLDITSHPIFINADRRRMEQVVINLVINARDAMPKGGQITLIAESYVLKSAEDRGAYKIEIGRYVRIKVCDSGVGIKSENLSKIFDPFFTTKPVGSGTGLGLSTVYGIVKQTGGYVSVESIEGQGSEFSVIVPESNQLIASVKSVPVKDRVLPQISKGILIVDDERSIRELLARSLIRSGHRVYDFDSIDLASKFLVKNSHMVSLIVTDIVMPDANGVDWIKHVRMEHPDMKVIFMSGYADENLLEETQRMTDTRFISKPFSLKELYEIIDY